MDVMGFDYDKVKDVPSMTSKEVHDFLYEIGKGWTGQGDAVELGSWLGGTTISLLEGLNEADYCRNFWAFDRWQANKSEVEKAWKQGVKIEEGEDLQPIFLHNVLKVFKEDLETKNELYAIKGDISKSIDQYFNLPEYTKPFWHNIEICIFDAPKKNPVFQTCIDTLLPYFIPGITVLGLMDYHHHKKFTGKDKERLLAPVNFIENNKDCFEMIGDFEPAEPVFFRYVKKIDQ